MPKSPRKPRPGSPESYMPGVVRDRLNMRSMAASTKKPSPMSHRQIKYRQAAGAMATEKATGSSTTEGDAYRRNARNRMRRARR